MRSAGTPDGALSNGMPHAVAPFTHTAFAGRVVFGRGTRHRAFNEVERLGSAAALVLSTPGRRMQAEALAAQLGTRSAGVFAGARRHTPLEVTERAVAELQRRDGDCVVSLGGGSAIGLGKAIALRERVPHIAIPTTYAGSEVTPVLGETSQGRKTTHSSPEIVPQVVIYDPHLTDELPIGISVASGMNAIAHAAEALYARDASPLSATLAVDALRTLFGALPAIVEEPGAPAPRDLALYGAWLCGTLLAGGGMSIHHKLCHALGGALDLPHAETHAVMLPHAVDLVEQAVPDALAPAADLLGPRAGQALWDFSTSIGAPSSLRELGVRQSDLDSVATLATSEPYWAPCPIERDGVRELLQEAWIGSRPS